MFGTRLKTVRQQNHLSMDALADNLNKKYNTKISKSMISRWENGQTDPSMSYVRILTDYFHKDYDYFIGDEPKPTNEIPINKVKNIPLVGSIAMGTPITAEQNIESYIPEYFIGDCPSGNLFALRCKGHSMEPTIPDGAIAIIREQSSVEDDEIAAVLIDNEATLKRVRHVGHDVVLEPDNKEFKPIIVDGNKSARILGKLIRYTVDF